jgi:4'-phosphopantetheinyl transferase
VVDIERTRGFDRQRERAVVAPRNGPSIASTAQVSSVEVWLAFPPAQGWADVRPCLERMLGPDERQRIAETDHVPMREQRLLAYALRRAVLARRLGIVPAAVPLDLVVDGPARVRGSHDIAVAISHSEGIAAVAVTRGARVGIDVECVRPRRDVSATARRFFHPSEADAVAGASVDQRLRMFFELWTRKESFAKGSGRDLFAVLPKRPRDFARWRILPLEPSPRHVGAVALELPQARASATCHVRVAERFWIWSSGDSLGSTVSGGPCEPAMSLTAP